ncbi:peptidyl-prolyl cis-trans isomerase [Mesobacillus maritimus]
MEIYRLRRAILILVVFNVLTIVFFLSRPDWKSSRETVATVGNEKITRQEWLNELETKYGEETLRDLIDKKVITTLAKEHKIKVSDDELEQELDMYKALYGMQENLSGDEWGERVRLSLLLEELLTKDAKISEGDLQAYYQENMDLFDLPNSYHLSQIIVKTLPEAKQTIEELEEGSSFAALAMERSLDEFSANEGGNLGYISEDDETKATLIEEAKGMTSGSWSDPVQMDSGYAVLYLHDAIQGKRYTFEEVKDQIHRQIAIEQMDIPVSAVPFWDEAEVSWFYGEKAKH